MKPNPTAPIGIFDSGIGGLTVAKAIKEVLPQESIIYFGDTAHMPYGDKSAEAIGHYAVKISDFLLEKGCKLIVIACNTASAIAFNTVKSHVKNKVEIINVIGPVLDYVLTHAELKKIGIIGTAATIRSNTYEKALKVRKSELDVRSLATPLLAPMIEEAFFNNNISQAVIDSYLSNPKLADIEALILGCTHYPLIKKEIESYYKNKIHVADSPAIVAERVKSVLKYDGLLNESKNSPHNEFYVSDYTESFEKTTRLFYKNEVKLQHLPLWD